MDFVKHLDHKIQPETESVMKMIMENPFVVKISGNVWILKFFLNDSLTISFFVF